MTILDLFSNAASATVASGGTTAPAANTVETWTVSNVVDMPTAVTGVSQFRVVDLQDGAAPHEVILVTNVSGTTWTVKRGQESTTPVTHAAGFTVILTVTAGAYNRFPQLPTGQSAFVSAFATGFLGDGSDGSVTLDGTVTVAWASKVSSVYTLTRDVFCTNLTVNSGISIGMGGFRLYCSGTLTNNGQIRAVGGNAVGAGAGGGGGASNTVAVGANGGAGAVGAASNGGNKTNCYGGAGGSGGTGTGGAAGSGGTATAPVALNGTIRALPMAALGQLLPLSAIPAAAQPGAGGGGGSGDGANAGGGGGGGGGFVLANCATLAGNGAFQATGGNGGNGVAGNAAGGGGGGGGVILINTTSTTSWTGTTSVVGGTHGTGAGTGPNGSDGSPGSVFLFVW